MRKLKLFSLALMALFSMSMWATDYAGVKDTLVCVGSTTNPGDKTKFQSFANCPGLYLYRAGSGSHSYSAGTADNTGLKMQNTYSGLVFYLSKSKNVTATIDYNSNKDFPTPTIKLLSLTEAKYSAIYSGTVNNTKVAFEESDTVLLNTKSITFTAKGVDSVTFENVAAGYYYIYATTSSSNTYFCRIIFETAASAPSFTSPASEPEAVYYEQNQAATALSVTATGGPAPTLQWYSNTSKTTEGATKLTGQTNATYTPSTATAGDFYYYCVATNASGTATSYFFHVNVDEAICPSGMSISGENEYSERTNIELTASLSEGNGEITYNWYKGADLAAAKAAGSIGTGTTYSKVSCAKSDAGNYFCVATKADCSEAASEAFEITITDYVCPTSGMVFSLEFTNTSKVTMSDGDSLYLSSTYASISGGTASIKYFRTGNTDKDVLLADHLIQYGTNDMYLRIELYCKLQIGDTIRFADGTTGELAIATDAMTPKDATHKVVTESYKYIVVKDDVLEGQSILYIGRPNTTTIKQGALTIIRPAGSPTAVENAQEEAAAVKFVKDGQLFIEKNGHVYNVLGGCVK